MASNVRRTHSVVGSIGSSPEQPISHVMARAPRWPKAVSPPRSIAPPSHAVITCDCGVGALTNSASSVSMNPSLTSGR